MKAGTKYLLIAALVIGYSIYKRKHRSQQQAASLAANGGSLQPAAGQAAGPAVATLGDQVSQAVNSIIAEVKAVVQATEPAINEIAGPAEAAGDVKTPIRTVKTSAPVVTDLEKFCNAEITTETQQASILNRNYWVTGKTVQPGSYDFPEASANHNQENANIYVYAGAPGRIMALVNGNQYAVNFMADRTLNNSVLVPVENFAITEKTYTGPTHALPEYVNFYAVARPAVVIKAGQATAATGEVTDLVPGQRVIVLGYSNGKLPNVNLVVIDAGTTKPENIKEI